MSQTLTTITVDPPSVNLDAGATQQFTATGSDQFGNPLASQPTFTWTTSVRVPRLIPAGYHRANATASGTVTASSGSIAGNNSAVSVTEHAPTVATAASATPSAVSGTTTNLSVLGADVDMGESSLTYTWTTTTLPNGAAMPTFSANGTNAAKNVTATFSEAGNYTFQVTITDPGNLSTTSSVDVTVSQTLTTITVDPPSVNLDAGATQQFTATGSDQFGNPLASQPTFTWTTSVAGGTINSSGLFTAPNVTSSGTVTASSASIAGNNSAVSVTDQGPTVATAASATPDAVSGTTTNLSVLGADVDTGESSLTYTWTATTLPSGAAMPTFSANGTNSAKNVTATFDEAGNYTFQVTITDPGNVTATSTVSVTVSQTLTAINLSDEPAAATALDQFGNALANQPAFDPSSDSITAPLALSGTVTVSATAGSQLTLAGGISGTGGLAINSPRSCGAQRPRQLHWRHYGLDRHTGRHPSGGHRQHQPVDRSGRGVHLRSYACGSAGDVPGDDRGRAGSGRPFCGHDIGIQ